MWYFWMLLGAVFLLLLLVAAWMSFGVMADTLLAPGERAQRKEMRRRERELAKLLR